MDTVEEAAMVSMNSCSDDTSKTMMRSADDLRYGRPTNVCKCGSQD